MKKLLVAPAMLAILLLPVSAYAATGSGSATGSVTIANTCGVSLSTGTIDYGTVGGFAYINATQNPIGVSNTGGATASLTVTGGNWTNSNTPYIYANETFVSLNPITVSQMNTAGPHLNFNGVPIVLTNNFQPAGVSGPIPNFWALYSKLVGPFTGSLSQTITYTASC